MVLKSSTVSPSRRWARVRERCRRLLKVCWWLVGGALNCKMTAMTRRFLSTVISVPKAQAR